VNARFKLIGTFSAVLLTGALLNPPKAEARTPRARELCGVIQSIDRQTHLLAIQPPGHGQPATFAVKSDTQFIKDGKSADSGALSRGLPACVYYHSPFFGKPFATKVVWLDGKKS
jgi:hypothetical protein